MNILLYLAYSQYILYLRMSQICMYMNVKSAAEIKGWHKDYALRPYLYTDIPAASASPSFWNNGICGTSHLYAFSL